MERDGLEIGKSRKTQHREDNSYELQMRRYGLGRGKTQHREDDPYELQMRKDDGTCQ